MAHLTVGYYVTGTTSGLCLQGIEEAVRALSLLLPGELHSFSAAKYLEGNHIDPHDDRSYTQVRAVGTKAV